MRQIGLLDREIDARRFAAFLVTDGMTAHAEREGDGWGIWVRDENHVEKAKEAFGEFRRNPEDPRYLGVERTAHAIRREEERQREQSRKNVIDIRGRWRQIGSRRRPFVLTLIALSVFVGISSNMGRQDGVVLQTLLFCSPAHAPDGRGSGGEPEDKLIDVRGGQLWRLITPIFVHYGPIHLAFNMYMLYQLGSLVEDRRGTWRFSLMILAIAACSNTAQALAPVEWGGSPFAAGMSGVVYGLFGYIWMKSLFEPELGIAVGRSTVVILLAWLLLGIAGALDTPGARIANWTHGVGFLVGVAIGLGPAAFRSMKQG